MVCRSELRFASIIVVWRRTIVTLYVSQRSFLALHFALLAPRPNKTVTHCLQKTHSQPADNLLLW